MTSTEELIRRLDSWLSEHRPGYYSNLLPGLTERELGEFESGVTAAWFGTVPAVVIGGIGTLLVVGIWTRLFPQLRKVNRLTDAATL